MREFECKLKCAAGDRAKALEFCGANALKPLGSMRQTDCYYTSADRNFIKEDIALRIRLIEQGENSQCRITYKGPNMTPGLQDREEFETGVEDGSVAAKILAALGFVPFAEVKKCRESYGRGSLSVCFDDVEDLGEFIEIEFLAEDDAPDMLRDIQEQMGLSGAVESRTYLELILRKKGLL